MNWKSVKFEWNNTRAFLVTAEEGTLSAAAKALGMTQPTLSRQVAALESEMGVTLFERVGQRLVLTSAGLELLQHARSMGNAALQFSLAASGQSQQIEGLVTISAGQLDAIYRLPKIIARLRQQEPGIDLEVVVTNDTSDLKRREADIAIRSYRPTQNDLIAKKLGEETIRLFGTPAYLDCFSPRPKADELTDIQVIGFDRSLALAEVLNQQAWELARQNFQLVTAFQPLQLELCKQGLGLILYPESMGDSHPELTRAFPHIEPVMELPMWLVCHQELRTSLRVRRVFDCIAEEFNRVVQ